MIIPDEWKDADFTKKEVIDSFNDWLEERRKPDEPTKVMVYNGEKLGYFLNHTIHNDYGGEGQHVRIGVELIGKESSEDYWRMSLNQMESLRKLLDWAIPYTIKRFKEIKEEQIRELESQIDNIKKMIGKLQ